LRPIATALEQTAFQSALALDREPDALVHRLVEPRHRGHHGRPHFDQIARQRLGAFGEIDFGGDRDREH
jgi:hypothetical protein